MLDGRIAVIVVGRVGSRWVEKGRRSSGLDCLLRGIGEVLPPYFARGRSRAAGGGVVGVRSLPWRSRGRRS